MATGESVQVGNVKTLTANWLDSDAELDDPSNAQLVVTPPRGDKQTYTYSGGEVEKAQDGQYYYDLHVTMAGLWRYRFFSTGVVEDDDVVASKQSSFWATDIADAS